jgi:hypothetical protein
MKQLGLGILLLVCTALVGCASSPPTSTSPQSQPVQYDPAGNGRGGMH